MSASPDYIRDTVRVTSATTVYGSISVPRVHPDPRWDKRSTTSKEHTRMNREDFPAPREGVIITHFLVVRDQDTSREWYRSVFGAEVVNERDPVILKLHNSWLILNVGGGPTDDKPDVTLEPPGDSSRMSAFLNVRVADIQQVYAEWSARGAEFLTPPIDRGAEIRCYIRDPDGHLIEVGQATGTFERFEEEG
jgi:lactoylglutathione lyase